MKTAINVDGKEIVFVRNWITGSFTYSIDGKKRNLASVLNPLTHYSIQLSRTYKAQVGETIVTIVKTRPLMFAGFRQNNYKFFIDNKLIKEVDAL